MAGVGPTEGIFRKDFVADGWGGGVGNKLFGAKLLSKSSMSFLADGSANCSAKDGMFERISRPTRSLPIKVARPGHIMCIVAPCLSTSPLPPKSTLRGAESSTHPKITPQVSRK